MTVRKARKLRSVAAVLLCSVLLIMASAIVFPRALAATNDTDGGIAVITEEGANQEEPSGEASTGLGDVEPGTAGDEGTTEPGTTGTEEEPAGTGSEFGESAEGDAAGEGKSEADKPAADSADNAEAEQNADDGVEPYSIQSIIAEQWVTNLLQGTFNLSGTDQRLVSAGIEGLPVSDLAPQLEGHTFWKVSLKGVDKGGQGQRDVNYGEIQQNAGDNQVNTGTEITAIRSNNGNLQFLGKDSGNWITLSNAEGSTTQLVFYYLQDMKVSDYVTFHMSDWFVEYGKIVWGGTKNSYAAAIEVVDDSNNTVLAKSEPMYWNYDNKGVKSITVTENDLGSYEIVSVTKSRAKTQNPKQWNYDTQSNSEIPKATGGKFNINPYETYQYSDVISSGMSTSWTGTTTVGDDPHYVVFTVHLRPVAQVSLMKKLAEDDESQKYANDQFEFTAQVTLPENSTSTLRNSYPADGLADGVQNVHGVISNDGKTVDLSGIKAYPNKSVTIKGLPKDAVVKFTEVGVIENGQLNKDPSLFQTSYTNDKESSRTDGSAIAKTNADERQTVTTRNQKSTESGKLVVKKTFTNVEQLSYAEKLKLRDTFAIESTDSQISDLMTSNAKSVEPEGGLIVDGVKKVTYTWELNHLKPGNATLTEKNYKVGGKVSSTTEVSTNGVTVSDSVSANISTSESNTVAFTNDYNVEPTSVTMRKAWQGVDNYPNNVTVELIGTVGEGENLREVSKQEVVLNNAENWSKTIANLPTRLAGTSENISYKLNEIKVGGDPLSSTAYEATYSTDNGTLVVTNSTKWKAALQITKEDAEDSGKKLQGAEFTLTKVGASGVTATTNANGIATFENLEEGTYTLEETKVPAGYQKLEGQYTVVVKKDQNGEFQATMTKPDETTPSEFKDENRAVDPEQHLITFKTTIENTGIQPIPSTGGTGNVPLFAAGMAAIAGAVIYLSKRTNL